MILCARQKASEIFEIFQKVFLPWDCDCFRPKCKERDDTTFNTIFQHRAFPAVKINMEQNFAPVSSLYPPWKRV